MKVMCLVSLLKLHHLVPMASLQQGSVGDEEAQLLLTFSLKATPTDAIHRTLAKTHHMFPT